MQTAFDDWLRLLAAAGKGGSEITPSIVPPAVRGDAWKCVIELPGDFSEATITGAIRNTPDAPATLASFSVSGGTYSSGTSTTTFTATLASGTGSNSTGILPADEDGDAIVALPAAFAITYLDGSAEMLFGFAFIVTGKV